jgi:signal peptidase II
VKKRTVFLIILLIVAADQALKIYVKTHYHLGESTLVIGRWFRIYFIENEGMAYGWKFGGEFGKMALTLFRLAAVIFGIFYIRKIIERKFHPAFIFCVALVFAGALGNLIDSMFYGLIFEDSTAFPSNIAHIFPAHGYAGFLHGKVVDMLYFPIIDSRFPSWFPFWGGEPFTFFSPIFNIADASISAGIIAIFVFQQKFFGRPNCNASVKTEGLINEEIPVS